MRQRWMLFATLLCVVGAVLLMLKSVSERGPRARAEAQRSETEKLEDGGPTAVAVQQGTKPKPDVKTSESPTAKQPNEPSPTSTSEERGVGRPSTSVRVTDAPSKGNGSTATNER